MTLTTTSSEDYESAVIYTVYETGEAHAHRRP
jgi:hypothetical protein